MKIIVVALNFFPEMVGCAKFTSEFVNWISNKSNKVIVITTNPFYPEWICKSNYYNQTTKNNILIIRCPIYVPKNVTPLKRVFHYISFYITSMPIILFFGLKKIDLIYSMCPTILSFPSIIIVSWIKKIFFRKKIVTWIHFADLEIEAAFKLSIFKNKFLKKLLLLYERIILKNADLISAISFYMLEKIKSKTNNNKRIFYLPDFIDIKKFNNLKFKDNANPFYKELSIKKEKIIIMYSGSINEKISCQTLVNSIKNLKHRKDLVWIICGDGPKKLFLEKSLKNLENVLFCDFQPYKKLAEWLDFGDIHLIPQKLSSVDFCLPSKLLGILAVGKPVVGIAPKDSELGRILDKFGVRLSSEESKEMSEAIVKLVDDKELRLNILNKSKNHIKKFHEKENVLNNMLVEVKKIISLN